MYLIKQAFAGCARVDQPLKSEFPLQEVSGYEAIKRFLGEFSLQSRADALHYRQQVMGYEAADNGRVLEVARSIEAEVHQFHTMILARRTVANVTSQICGCCV